jgi:hypothetical protein
MTNKEYKTAFHDLVFEINSEDATNINFFKFQNTLKLVSTLLRNNKERELNKILRLHFPEYYNDSIKFEISE